MEVLIFAETVTGILVALKSERQPFVFVCWFCMSSLLHLAALLGATFNLFRRETFSLRVFILDWVTKSKQHTLRGLSSSALGMTLAFIEANLGVPELLVGYEQCEHPHAANKGHCILQMEKSVRTHPFSSILTCLILKRETSCRDCSASSSLLFSRMLPYQLLLTLFYNS